MYQKFALSNIDSISFGNFIIFSDDEHSLAALIFDYSPNSSLRYWIDLHDIYFNLKFLHFFMGINYIDQLIVVSWSDFIDWLLCVCIFILRLLRFIICDVLLLFFNVGPWYV